MKSVVATPRTARLVASLLLLGVAAGSLGACNTFHGAGQDVRSAGGGISDASDATKAKIQDTTK